MNRKVILSAIVVAAILVGGIFYLTNKQVNINVEKPTAKKELIKPEISKSQRQKKVFSISGYQATEDFRWLIQQSKAIVIGSVESTSGVVTAPAFGKRDGLIFTKWKVKVLKNIKNNVSESIIILNPGGETSQTILNVENSVNLKSGQKYVFFLTKNEEPGMNLNADTFGLKSTSNVYKIVNNDAISKNYKLPLKTLLSRIDEGLKQLPAGSDSPFHGAPLGVNNFKPEPSPLVPITVN